MKEKTDRTTRLKQVFTVNGKGFENKESRTAMKDYKQSNMRDFFKPDANQVILSVALLTDSLRYYKKQKKIYTKAVAEWTSILKRKLAEKELEKAKAYVKDLTAALKCLTTPTANTK